MKKILVGLVIFAVLATITEEIVLEHTAEPHASESPYDTSPIFISWTTVSGGTATPYAAPVNFMSNGKYSYN